MCEGLGRTLDEVIKEGKPNMEWVICIDCRGYPKQVCLDCEPFHSMDMKGYYRQPTSVCAAGNHPAYTHWRIEILEIPGFFND